MSRSWSPAVLCLLLACAGEDGAVGEPCTVEDDGQGNRTVRCPDGTSATIPDGGAGTGCTASVDDGGARVIACEDGSRVVLPPGSPGVSCTVSGDDEGSRTIACDDGTSVTISDGRQGTACTVTSNGDGTRTIACPDGSSATVADGADGTACSVAANPDGTQTISCSDGSAVVVAGAVGTLHGVATLYGRADSSGILVSVVGTGLFTATDPGGAWSVSGIPSGTHPVLFEFPGYPQLQLEDVAVLPGSTGLAPVVLRVGIRASAGDWRGLAEESPPGSTLLFAESVRPPHAFPYSSWTWGGALRSWDPSTGSSELLASSTLVDVPRAPVRGPTGQVAYLDATGENRATPACSYGPCHVPTCGRVQRTADLQLWSGSGPSTRIAGGVEVGGAVFSPSGALLFVRDTEPLDGTGELVLRDPAGAEAAVSSTACRHQIAVAADGAAVAFLELSLVPASYLLWQGAGVPTTELGPEPPVFAPDGRSIAFRRGAELILRDLASGSEVVVSSAGSSPLRFAPDGGSLLSSGAGGTLHRHELATGATILLGSAVLAGTESYGAGSRLVAFSLRNADGTVSAAVWDAATGATTTLDAGVGPSFPSWYGGELPPVISPDGSAVLFAERATPAGGYDLALWDAASAAATPVGTGGAPGGFRFSPDGRWLVLLQDAVNIDGFWARGELILWDVAGATGVLLAQDGGGLAEANDPSWPPLGRFSPDGSRLAFLRDFSAGAAAGELVVRELASGSELPIDDGVAPLFALTATDLGYAVAQEARPESDRNGFYVARLQ